ncbi:multicopper oxidase domain-containing protein [Kocuria sp. CPCC 205300]|uniref:multicopper oxidase domain-containing protein n=1 Tax=Kocuria sabuli TaxID=3071448 RepID=UPI0036DC7BDB
MLGSQAPLPEAFRTTLPIPPALQPIRSTGSTDYYETTQRIGQATTLAELTTEVWGYEGILPGPTLDARRGRRTVVTHSDELPVPVSVHLHGGARARRLPHRSHPAGEWNSRSCRARRHDNLAQARTVSTTSTNPLGSCGTTSTERTTPGHGLTAAWSASASSTTTPRAEHRSRSVLRPRSSASST